MKFVSFWLSLMIVAGIVWQSQFWRQQIAVSPTPVVGPKVNKVTPQPQVVVISEGELRQALVTYRQSHNRQTVIWEENLCRYARNRLKEHQDRFESLSEDESALDGHAGFERDADSGSLWQEIGGSFTNVGEVLAYIPRAQSATQVIEWGWDTSSAHREGLLSNDFSHVCITGQAPFFVGILGKM